MSAKPYLKDSELYSVPLAYIRRLEPKFSDGLEKAAHLLRLVSRYNIGSSDIDNAPKTLEPCASAFCTLAEDKISITPDDLIALDKLCPTIDKLAEVLSLVTGATSFNRLDIDSNPQNEARCDVPSSIFNAVSGNDGESPLLSRRCVWGMFGYA